MKKIFLILFLLLPSFLFAVESIQSHNPVYFTAGDKENQVKYQVSFKYALYYPFETGLFLGYTQIARWDMYDRSSPFREINHNPEIFWEMENVNQWLDLVRIAPYSHISNGRDGKESRSIESGYAETQVSYGQTMNIGINEKYTYFYRLSNHNKDYRRYKGNFRTELFLQLKGKGEYLDQEKIYVAGEWTHKSWWAEAGIMVRLLTDKIQPKIYVQGYWGTAEFLEDYKHKSKAVRAGFIFNN